MPGALKAAVACLVVALASRPGAGVAVDLKSFKSIGWGLSARYPADIEVSDTFTPNYFDRGDWRVSYAAAVGPGERIVAFKLPALHNDDAGGESDATAELRIGASRDPDVVASCLTFGMNSGDNVESGTREIGGVTFTEVPDNADGGMRQRIRTDDFRAVHDGACYAIDIVRFVEGTSNKRPRYAPARIEQLRGILDTIRFDRA